MVGLIVGSLLLTVGEVCILNSYFSLKISSVFILCLAIICSGLLALFDKYKTQKIIYLICMVIFVMGSLICYYYNVPLIEKINETYHWAMHYDQTESSYVELYARCLMLGLIVILSLVNYVSQKKSVTKGIIGLANLGLLACMGYMQIDVYKIGIVSILTFVLLTIIENQYRMCYGKRKQEEARRMAVYFIPFCLVIVLSTVLLPAHKTPVKWKLIRGVGASIQEKLSDLGASFAFSIGNQSGEFGLDFLSYDEKSNLGGDINLEENIMLQARIKPMTHRSLYLAGSYKDTYTGKSWSVNKNEPKDNKDTYKLDAYELLYAIARDETLANDTTLIIEGEVELTYEKIRTRTLFIPPKMLRLKQIGKQNQLSESKAGILYNRRQGQGTMYSASFIEVNVMSQTLQEKLRRLDDFSYSGKNQITNKEMNATLSHKVSGATLGEIWNVGALDEALKKRSQEIQLSYTQLPEDFSWRVQKLTQEITKNCHNKFDQLKAIEAYLRTYSYTTTPGKMPEHEDFIDYFLFESKAGYCTYFASAMAMMGRCIDIPTRYVEGFIVDYEKAEGNVGAYVVRGKKAHAWAEAYFKGFGWVAFEPSPGYESPLYYPYENEKDIITTSEASSKEDKASQATSMPSVVPELQESDTQTLSTKGNLIKTGLLFIGRLLLLIILFIIGIQCFLRWQYHRAFIKADTSSKFKMRFYEMLYLLEKEGIKLKSEETLSEYGKRIENLEGGEGGDVKQMIAAYVKLKYSEKPLSNTEGEILERAYQTFIKDEQGKIGVIKLFRWRFIYHLARRKKL